VIAGTQVVESYDLASGVTQRVRAVNSRSYYDADERLRVFQQYDTDFSGNKGSGVWEEYRYDPLGRRVLVRTRRENPLCYGDAKTCISSVTRFVWSGDQILWEVKDATGSYAADAGGRVSYVHAGGIDRPLAIWKQGVGTLVTHQNWRGQFAMGTFTSGAPSDCQQYPPSGCVPVSWPGWSTTAWHEKVGQAPTTGYEHYWMGSLASGMRDASGQMYMRNRYYDPATGQFTQPDPIGLAGGLNAYGFAVGDPVSYADPYGLKVCFLGDAAEVTRLRDATSEATGASIRMNGNCIASVGPATNSALRGLRNRLERLVADDSVYSVALSGYSGCPQEGSHFCPETRVARITEFSIGMKFPAKYRFCGLVGAFGAGPKITESVPSIVAHEFLGHAWHHAVATGLTYDTSERSAIRAENNYHRAQPSGRERCGG
jgi:RHS repeat-associated protein